MTKDLDVQSSSTASEETQERSNWIKPEAKAADVAESTLSGHTTPTVTDAGTCAS